MRKLALAVALASTALATPAVARDGSPYFGVEGGLMIVEDIDFDLDVSGEATPNELMLDHNRGLDIDVIGGYDFGMFRVEGELGYKRAGLDEFGLTGLQVADFELDGSTRVLSAMLNGLLDFGGDDGARGYVGGGLGLARVKVRADSAVVDDIELRGSDSGLAWQLIAGLSTALSSNMEIGLKYRFFNVPNLQFSDEAGTICGPFGCEGRDIALDGRLRTHSLLASLIFNLAPPPPPPPPPVEVAPPPPPPPPPATQTCPDGSVILATEVCPAPPPPPPPPPPAPERG